MNDPVAVILLISGAHGLLLFPVFFFWKKNSLANKIFSVLILIIAFNLLHIFCEITGIEGWQAEIFNIVPRFLYGPLILLYVQVLTGWISRFKLKHLLHFLPALVDAVFMAAFPETALLYSGNPEAAGAAMTFIEDTQTLLYFGIAFSHLLRFRRNITSFFSSLARLKIKWLYALFAVLTLFRFYSFIEIVVLMAGWSLATSLDNASLILESLFIYGISYTLLVQREVFDDVISLEIYKNEIKTENGKYKGTGLKESNVHEYYEKLLLYMHEKTPYRQSELTLKILAEKLDIHPHHLSQIINSQTNKNFYSFINGYRVAEACKILKEEERESYTILSLAYDTGFNSKTTFNEVFKKFTGKTPTEYRKENS